MVIVMALLAAGLIPAHGQKDLDPRFPAFDPSKHRASEVVQALRDNLFVRLRMHYDEEALVVALETKARFNGKLSPRDQARLDELVARCLMVNRSEWDQARALLERADQVRSDNGWHEAANYSEARLLTDNLGTRFRLPLWAAECALEAGDGAGAARLFQQAAGAAPDLFGGDFQAMLAAAEQSVRSQGSPSIDSVGLLDVSYWRFWDDLAAWSRLITGAMRSGSGEILNEPELARRVEAIVASGLIRMESYVDTTEYRYHTVGRGCLDNFLDVVVAYAESRPRKAGDGPALARRVLDQLEEMEEYHVFAHQPARLLRLDISHHGLADTGDITRLMNLLRKAELWRKSGIYGLVVSALAEGQQPVALGEAVLYGKHISISRLARELDRAQRAGRQPYRRYEEAYGTWVDHRLRFGYAHPATVDRWDAAGDLLWDLSEPDGTSSRSRFKDEGALYPVLSEGTVAIEFLRVPAFSFVSGEGWRDTDGTFVAVVFNADRTVQVVPLGGQSEVTQAVEAFRTTMMPDQAGTSTPEQRSAAAASAVALLSERILAPLMNGSREVRKAGTWVVGLEGALEVMPLFALHWEGRELGLTKTVIHVSQVAGWRPRSPAGGEAEKWRALLVGRPDYSKAGLATPQPMAGARSLDLGTEFGDLPGTGKEVEDLEKLFHEQGIACTVQTGVLASERGLRSAAADHSIIHLATHGYYLPDEGAGAAPTDLSEADALFRSAVVLSGVNRTQREFRAGRYFPAEDDGILMAAELLPLDWRHVKLLTLSACDTALGEVSEGGGVAGLTQGAAVAGVRDMVVSLWPVDDLATPELMLAFYRRFLAGEDAQMAMIQAQRELFERLKGRDGWHEALRLTAPFRLVTNTLRGTAPLASAGVKTTSVVRPGGKSQWIIACQADKSKATAEKYAAQWRARGLPAGVLWIPDYRSLSGAEYWLTYVGPWDYADGKSVPSQILKTKVKPHYGAAFGIRLDQTEGREQF